MVFYAALSRFRLIFFSFSLLFFSTIDSYKLRHTQKTSSENLIFFSFFRINSIYTSFFFRKTKLHLLLLVFFLALTHCYQMTFIDLDKPQMNKSFGAKHHSIKSKTEMIDEVWRKKIWLGLEFVTETKALNEQVRFSSTEIKLDID